MPDFDVFELLEWVESFNSSSDILGKLTIRDRVHQALTAKVLGEISHPLTEGINAFSGTKDSIDWSSIEVIAGLEDYVRVIGYSLPSVGASIVVEGQKILMTEENRNKYKKVIRFVLPTKLIKEDKLDALVNFIADLSSIATVASDRDMENLLKAYQFNNADRLTQLPIYHKILDKATRPADVLGFDTTNLSDEQIKSLFLLGPSLNEIQGKLN